MGRWSPEISLPAEYSPHLGLCSLTSGVQDPCLLPPALSSCQGSALATLSARPSLKPWPFQGSRLSPFRAGAAVVLWSLLDPLPSGATCVPLASTGPLHQPGIFPDLTDQSRCVGALQSAWPLLGALRDLHPLSFLYRQHTSDSAIPDKPSGHCLPWVSLQSWLLSRPFPRLKARPT